MYDGNVMPYGADDERNTLIDDDGTLHPPGTFDEHTTVIVGGRAFVAVDGDTVAVDDGDTVTIGGKTIDVSGLKAHGRRISNDARRAAIVGEPAQPIGGGYYVHGDTPAYRRTGVTDQQAARWPETAVHSDAFDGDDANRPLNGLGTYHESDGAW